MITIIVGTNRAKSNSEKFGNLYYQELIKSEKNVHIIYLKDITPALYHADMYDTELQSELLNIQQNILLPSNKFLFIIPEYNAGMPGALKLFIDALSIYQRDETFKGKKAMIAGISSGRAGNLRGMEHLTSILNYLGTIVLPNRQPFSSIYNIMDANGNITDEATLKIIQSHAQELLQF